MSLGSINLTAVYLNIDMLLKGRNRHEREAYRKKIHSQLYMIIRDRSSVETGSDRHKREFSESGFYTVT